MAVGIVRKSMNGHARYFS